MNYRTIVSSLRDRILSVMKRPTYNYDVSRCEVAEFPTLEALNSDIGRTLIIICPDDENTVEQAGALVQKEAFLDIVAARELRQGDNDNIWTRAANEDSRTTTQDKLVEDIDRAIFSWRYQGIAENIEVLTADRSAERTNIERWGIVFIRVRLQWEETWAATE